MAKKLLTTLIFLMLAPAIIAAPAYNNPWFAWRSLDQAKKQLDISNITLNNEQCVFSNKSNTVVFKNGRRMAVVDGVTVWLNVAPETAHNAKSWRVSAIDLDLLTLAMQAESAKKPKPLRVMIDAGHGGNDSGAVSKCKTLKEKDVTLDLALQTGKLLKKAGIKVFYTRTKDRTLSLNERSAAASKQKADLFISIHANKAGNINASGIETFVLTPSGYPGTSANSPPRGWQIGNKNDYNSNLLGYTIQKALIGEANTFDRGLKRQSFFVLRETYCPASLIEVGFLSNSGDLKKMKSKKWRNACAKNISEGVLDYCKKVDSLEKAVAAKRKRQTESSKRWREFIAAKKTKQTEADLHKKPIAKATNKKNTSAKAKIAKVSKPKNVLPAPTPAPSLTEAKQKKTDTPEKSTIDLNKLTETDVQSIATNIYLTKKATGQKLKQQNEADMKSLMEFYEKGSLN